MSAVTDNEAIARKFGLSAIPEYVQRLGQLVSRETAPREEVAKLICQDKVLMARLLRAANPRATCEDDYVITSVDGALMRSGVGCAVLLAMGDPLMRAVIRTFDVMLAAPLNAVEPGVTVFPAGTHVIAKVSFKGRASGSVCLRLPTKVATFAAAHVLGVTAEEVSGPAEVDDVIGELANMVVGNFKSNLCDAGLDCKLSPPAILRTDDLKLPAIPGGLAERMGFSSKEINLFVDILVDPWS